MDLTSNILGEGPYWRRQQTGVRSGPSESARAGTALRSPATGSALDSKDAIDDGSSGDEAKCSMRTTSLNASVSASEARSRHRARDWICEEPQSAGLATGHGTGSVRCHRARDWPQGTGLDLRGATERGTGHKARDWICE